MFQTTFPSRYPIESVCLINKEAYRYITYADTSVEGVWVSDTTLTHVLTFNNGIFHNL